MASRRLDLSARSSTATQVDEKTGVEVPVAHACGHDVRLMCLQTIVSREVAAKETDMVTVGAIHAGTKSNIITDSAELLINTRAYSSEVSEHLKEAFDAYFGDESCDLDPVPASEDFSVIPDELGVPYTYWGLGGFADTSTAVGNHNPAFAPDLQPTLDCGTEAIVVAASAWLAR